MSHITKTKFPANFIVHSDHGSQYSSSDYLTWDCAEFCVKFENLSLIDKIFIKKGFFILWKRNK